MRLTSGGEVGAERLAQCLAAVALASEGREVGVDEEVDQVLVAVCSFVGGQMRDATFFLARRPDVSSTVAPPGGLSLTGGEPARISVAATRAGLRS
jgi:hypothetical protein